MNIEEKQVTLRILRPTTEDNWLYNENVNTFSQLVYLAKDDDGSGWSEITENEKIELEVEDMPVLDSGRVPMSGLSFNGAKQEEL